MPVWPPSPSCSPVAKTGRILSQPCLRLRCNQHQQLASLGPHAERLIWSSKNSSLFVNDSSIKTRPCHFPRIPAHRHSLRSPANLHFQRIPAITQKNSSSRWMRSFCLCESPFNTSPHPYMIHWSFPRPLFTAHYFSRSPGWAVDYFLAVRVVNGFRHEEANSQDHWPSSDLHSGVTFEVPCGFQKVVSTRFQRSSKLGGRDKSSLLITQLEWGRIASLFWAASRSVGISRP